MSTAKLDVELCTPVDIAGAPSAQYVKIDEVMDICARLGERLALHCPERAGIRQVVIKALRELVDHGPPLERIMLYEIANRMHAPDSNPLDQDEPAVTTAELRR